MSIVPTTTPPRVVNSASRFASDSYEPPSPTPTSRTFTPTTSQHVRRPSAPSPNPSFSTNDAPVLPSSYQSSSAQSSSDSRLIRMDEEEGESEKVTSGGERYGGEGGGGEFGTVRSTMSSRWDEGTEPGDREIDEEVSLLIFSLLVEQS